MFRVVAGRKKLTLLVLSMLAGLLSGIAIHSISWLLGLFCYVPVFYLLLRFRTGTSGGMLAGAVTGAAQALVMYGWIFPVVADYTGQQLFPGVLIWLVLVVINSVKFLVIFGLIGKVFRRLEETERAKWLTAPLAASIFVGVEALIGSLRGLPWIYSFLGYTQTTNIWFLQLAELGGVGIITWFLLVINVFLAYSLAWRSSTPLTYAVFLLILIHIYGFARIHMLESRSTGTLKLALLCDNSPPELRWNESELDRYVHRLFELNRQALVTRPDIVVWNESVIPWTFREDDDFLLYILGQNSSQGVSHLISYYTEGDSEKEYPSVSAYLIRPDGSVAGRYDKSELLAGVERPLFRFAGQGSLQLPFSLDNTLADHSENPFSEPLVSGYGSIGVMICNESSRDVVPARLAGQGVELMVLMSNNAWFDNSALVRLHFYFTRMRAVENRTAIAINSNMGISGITDHTGRILSYYDGMQPTVLEAWITLTDSSGNYLYRRNVFYLAISGMLLLTLVLLFYRGKTHRL